MSWHSQYAYWKARQFGLVPADTFPTPTIASATGTTTVVITGSGFMAAKPRPDVGTSYTLDVYFGTTLATSFTVDSATQITAQGSWNGTDAVVVHTSGGCATLAVAAVTFHILTEASGGLLTEAGNSMRTE